MSLIKPNITSLIDAWEKDGNKVDLDFSHEFFGLIQVPQGILQESHWFPILYCLYKLGISCELEVRSNAIHSLFEILHDYYIETHSVIWKPIFCTIMTLLFDIKTWSSENPSKVSDSLFMTEWISTTYMIALRSLNDLVSLDFDRLVECFDMVLGFYRNSMLNGKFYSYV